MTRIVIHNHLPRSAKDTNAFEHAVSREQEEKNRDEAYRKAGITRVGRDAKGVLTKRLDGLINEYRAKKITRKQLEDEFAKGGISKSDLRWLLDEEATN